MISEQNLVFVQLFGVYNLAIIRIQLFRLSSKSHFKEPGEKDKHNKKKQNQPEEFAGEVIYRAVIDESLEGE